MDFSTPIAMPRGTHYGSEYYCVHSIKAGRVVKEQILKDLLNNFSIKIGNELIAEKFRIRDWIENSREFPVNAYIAIWKGEETELWVCDTTEPKTDKRVA